MKTKRVVIVLGFATIFYILWQFGFDYVWANIVKAGVSTITAAFSDIQKVTIDNTGEAPVLYFYYTGRNNHVDIEYALPIILLLAWQASLFVIKNIPRRFAFKSLGINVGILWLIQIFFPLLLFNISTSKIKGSFFFLGLQIFGILVLFLIIKDSISLKYENQSKNK